MVDEDPGDLIAVRILIIAGMDAVSSNDRISASGRPSRIGEWVAMMNCDPSLPFGTCAPAELIAAVSRARIRVRP